MIEAMIQLAQILMIASTGQRYRHGQQLRGRLGLTAQKREIGCAEKMQLAMAQARNIHVRNALRVIFGELAPCAFAEAPGRMLLQVLGRDTGHEIPLAHDPYEGWFAWAVRVLNEKADDPGWMMGIAADMHRLFPDMLLWIEEIHLDPRATGAGWGQVASMVDAWVEEREAVRRGHHAQEGAPVDPAVMVILYDDGAHIDRLVSQEHFADEGNAMVHCIGGPGYEDGMAEGDGEYWKGSRDGGNAVYSYRDADGVPRATLHVDIGGYIASEEESDILAVQLQGAHDDTIRDAPHEDTGDNGVARGRISRFIHQLLKIRTSDQVKRQMGHSSLFPAGHSTAKLLLKLEDLERSVQRGYDACCEGQDTCGLGAAFANLAGALRDYVDLLKFIEKADEDDLAKVTKKNGKSPFDESVEAYQDLIRRLRQEILPQLQHELFSVIGFRSVSFDRWNIEELYGLTGTTRIRWDEQAQAVFTYEINLDFSTGRLQTWVRPGVFSGAGEPLEVYLGNPIHVLVAALRMFMGPGEDDGALLRDNVQLLPRELLLDTTKSMLSELGRGESSTLVFAPHDGKISRIDVSSRDNLVKFVLREPDLAREEAGWQVVESVTPGTGQLEIKAWTSALHECVARLGRIGVCPAEMSQEVAAAWERLIRQQQTDDS
jgi:hypothetical protein